MTDEFEWTRRGYVDTGACRGYGRTSIALQWSGFDEHDARNDRVRRACIHIFQAWRGEEILLEEGMSKQTVIAETDDGPVIKKEPHHLHRYILERDQEAHQILTDLGVFDLLSES